VRYVSFVTAVAVAVTMASPAHAGFARIGFHYTSLAHLGFNGSVARVPFDVPTTVDMLANFLREGRASIRDIKEHPSAFSQTQPDAACEAWVHSIYKQEWAAYDKNKYSEFKKILRKEPPECGLPKAHWLQYGFSVTSMPTGEGRGMQIIASIDRAISQTSTAVRPMFSAFFGPNAGNAISMVPSMTTSTIPFETVLLLHVWRGKGDDHTSVFVFGLPKSGDVEAFPGAGISYNFREVADGRLEASAVQNVLSYLKQKALVATDSPNHPK